MADFKTIDPASLAWAASWYRGQPVARLADGGEPAATRLIVRNPMAPCSVSLVGSGMYRVDMAYGQQQRAQPRVHSDFCAWLCELDEAAGAACRADATLAAWCRGKSQSSTLFKGGFRVTAFSDTLCFDRDGKLSFDLLDAQCCSCLLELQGCWSSEARWGLRWKITQIKFDTEPMAAPPAAGPEDQETAEPAAKRVAFAFLDD